MYESLHLVLYNFDLFYIIFIIESIYDDICNLCNIKKNKLNLL